MCKAYHDYVSQFKKKVLALANPDLHKLASKLLFSLEEPFPDGFCLYFITVLFYDLF